MQILRGYKLHDPRITYRELAQLGSLALLAGDKFDTFAGPGGEQMAGRRVEFGRFMASLRPNRGTCVCLPNKLRLPLAKALVSFYGQPENWTPADLLAMGDMVTLLDHISIGQINKESMRKAAPHIMKQSCFPIKYESFPGRLDQPTFEQVCLETTYDGETIAESSGQSIDAYKRALFAGIEANIRIAMAPLTAKDQEVTTDLPVEITSNPTQITTLQITTEAATPQPLTKEEFFLRVIEYVSEEYRNVDQWPIGQTKIFQKLVEQMANNTRTKIAEVLQKDISEVPADSNQLTPYLGSIRDTISTIQMQQLKKETGKVRDEYAIDLIQAFNWTEEDFSIDRKTFCNFVKTCVDEETTQAVFLDVGFDPEFDLARSLPGDTNQIQVSPKSSCLEVESSGFASSVVTISDLETWPENEVYECMEVLAGVSWPDKAEFWDFVKKTVVS